MPKENTDLELIKRLGAIVEYLGALSQNGIIFYSEELLPASRSKMESAVALLSIVASSESDKELLNSVPLLLDHFIPHDDALKLVQSWNKVKPKFEGKDYDRETEAAIIDIMRKYTGKWKS